MIETIDLFNNEEEEGYGNLYWCISTPTSRIHTYADLVEVSKNGDLILIRKDKTIMMAFAAEKWENIYAASCMDGSPVSVEHWQDKGS